MYKNAEMKMAPSCSFNMYTFSPSAAMCPGSFMMTHTHKLSGPDIADSSSSWSRNDNPVALSPAHNSLPSHGLESLDLERHSQSPTGRCHPQGAAPSLHRLRARRKTSARETQR